LFGWVSASSPPYSLVLPTDVGTPALLEDGASASKWVDTQLELWGIVTPSAYTYADTVDGTHHYDATLRLR